MAHGAPGGLQLAFPEFFTGFGGEAEDVEPSLQRAAGGTHEEAIADDDRAAQSAAWQLDFPFNGGAGPGAGGGGAIDTPEIQPVRPTGDRAEQEAGSEEKSAKHWVTKSG